MNPENQPSEENTHQETNPPNINNDGGVEAKRRIRSLITFGLVATIFGGLAGIFVSLHGDYTVEGLVCLWLFFIFAAVGFIVDFKRYQGRHKTAYLGGAAVIIFGTSLSSVLLWRDFRIKMVERLQTIADVLEPANEPAPATISDSGITGMVQIPKGEVGLFLGNMVLTTSADTLNVIRLYGSNLLTIAKSRRGILVSANLQSEDGRFMMLIDRNKFVINANHPDYWFMERPDTHTLVVYSQHHERVFYVKYVNPSAIRILGIFRAKGEFPVLIDEDHMRFGPLQIGPGFATHLADAPIFDWPRPNYPDARSFAITIDGNQYHLLQFNRTNNGVANFTFEVLPH